MPSRFDPVYHKRFAQPIYDSDEDRKIQQLQREADEVLELRPPPVPTHEQEVEYIDWLKDDIKQDPWLIPRWRKYSAGPKRIAYKNINEIKR